MRVSTLFKDFPRERWTGDPDVEVTGLHYDSRQVEPGGVFFALRGEQSDGHRFIDEAVARGARAVVMERERPLPPGVAGLVVANARRVMALAAAAYFSDPTAGIPVLGVTGTNGKTTFTYLMEAILLAAGKRPAVLGTVNYRFGGRLLPSLHTTPESVELLRTLAGFRQKGCNALVLEVSSHALSQHRVEGVHFSLGVFTNLTPEHLDYHGDMEDYFASKSRFFDELLPRSGGRAVINIDDPYGARLAGRLTGALTCGTTGTALVRPREVRLSAEGIEGTMTTPLGDVPLRSRLVGRFNLHNILCAVAAGAAMGLSTETIARGVTAAPQVPGRMERIENRLGALILVDYAHTGDALEKVLAAVEELVPRRILTVFGCGGDRDRSKRPVMGEAAARRSDLVILTSDNPRTEDPLAILDEIRPGVQRLFPREWTRDEALAGAGKGFVVIPDRREAIAFAVKALRRGDALLVAGKGHEDYQIIGCQRHHFDDREELQQALARLEEGA